MLVNLLLDAQLRQNPSFPNPQAHFRLVVEPLRLYSAEGSRALLLLLKIRVVAKQQLTQRTRHWLWLSDLAWFLCFSQTLGESLPEAYQF